MQIAQFVMSDFCENADDAGASRRRAKQWNFDLYIERMGDRNRTCSCSKRCFNRLSATSLRTHAKVLDLHCILDLPTYEAWRVHWAKVMSVYLMCTNERGNIGRLRHPAFLKQTFSLSAWLELMDISKRTFQCIRTSIVVSRDFVRDAHGNVGEKHALKQKVGASVEKYAVDAANEHRHPLTMYVSTRNGSPFHDEESLLVLTPAFSKRRLSASYNKQVTDDRLKVCRTSFVRLMK